MVLALNIFLGCFPTFALAWSMAADERKPAPERVAVSDADRSRQRTMFLLVYGLWALTLAMWNWMRSAPVAWIVLWAFAGLVALGISYRSRRKP